MVGISKGTAAFIKATDYLKGAKRLKHGDIATNIGLSRSQYDQSRGGRRTVTSIDIENLIKIYPETKDFFGEDNNSLNEPAVNYLTSNTNESELVKSLREIIKSKDKVIELLEAKVKDLEEDVNARREAHAETLAQLYTVEEAEALVKELKEKERGE